MSNSTQTPLITAVSSEYISTAFHPTNDQPVEHTNTSLSDTIAPNSTYSNDNSTMLFVLIAVAIIVLCSILAITAFIQHNRSQKPHQNNHKSDQISDEMQVLSKEPGGDINNITEISVSVTQNEGLDEAAIILTVMRSYSEGNLNNGLQPINDEKEQISVQMFDIVTPDGYERCLRASVDDIREGDVILYITSTNGYRRSIHEYESNIEDVHNDPVISSIDESMETPGFEVNDSLEIGPITKEKSYETHLSAKKSLNQQKSEKVKGKRKKGKIRMEKRKIILTRRGLAALSKVELVKICKKYNVNYNGHKRDIVARLLDNVDKKHKIKLKKGKLKK